MIEFFVPGTPRVKGNMRSVCRYGKGRCKPAGKDCHPFTTEGYKENLKVWMRAIVAASLAHRPLQPIAGAVHVDLHFEFRRPLAPKHDYPFHKGDGEKLERAVMDALQTKGKWGGVLIVDDNQRVTWSGSKRWSTEREGVLIRIRPLGAEQETLL